jgi:beta-glucosidase
MPADLNTLIASLTLEEKASLTAGADMWGLPPVERLGIGALTMTDGPNGARGRVAPGEPSEATTCVPCGTALGATWDPDLVGQVGALLGREARAKGCRVLLAPTVNIPRSPLAGRTFECYAEDPLVSGRLAAGFVAGVQSAGVAATVKHFVANDAETDRMIASSEVDERTLRELYLVPFEWAVRAGSLAVMTGYNRLNGTWCAEHRWLLDQVARGTWGFDGLVMTDWYAVATTGPAAEAGLDVEMPGPGRAYGPALADAVRRGEVDEATVDAQVRRILSVHDRLGLLAPPEPDPPRPPEDERRDLARRAATGSMVLLRNDGLLPLAPDVGRVALLGPLAGSLTIMGGGSAQVASDPPVAFPDALAARLAPGSLSPLEQGADVSRAAPVLELAFTVEFYDGGALDGPPGAVPGEARHRVERPTSEAMFIGAPYGVVEGAFSLRATATWVPAESGSYRVTLVETGRARVVVDGTVVVDGFDGTRERGEAFMGLARTELSGVVTVTAGQPVTVAIDYDGGDASMLNAYRVGCHPLHPPGDLIERAAEAAATADVAVLVVGTTAEWESEGFDRTTLHLPADQDALVEAVLAANRRTVVVVNTAGPVALPWADRAGAVIQAWFGGQEMGPALADVLTGLAEPGGRLPVTLPERVEDTPAFGNFPGDHAAVRYGEGVLVGYRWYGARRMGVRFPFGHGLSYTTFELGRPTVTGGPVTAEGSVSVSLTVTNTGTRPGSEVVQCYVEPPPGPVTRPPLELRGFAKVHLAPGASTTVTLELGARAFTWFDVGDAAVRAGRARLPTAGLLPADVSPPQPAGWRADPGPHILHVGRSSEDLAWRAEVAVTGFVLPPEAPPG